MISSIALVFCHCSGLLHIPKFECPVERCGQQVPQVPRKARTRHFVLVARQGAQQHTLLLLVAGRPDFDLVVIA